MREPHAAHDEVRHLKSRSDNRYPLERFLKQDDYSCVQFGRVEEIPDVAVSTLALGVEAYRRHTPSQSRSVVKSKE